MITLLQNQILYNYALKMFRQVTMVVLSFAIYLIGFVNHLPVVFSSFSTMVFFAQLENYPE